MTLLQVKAFVQIFFYILARILSVPCDLQKPKKPLKASAVAVSESQVLVMWSKPLGPGYNFRVVVKLRDVILKVLTGETGFGNSKAIVVNWLQPNIEYNFTMEHECAVNPGHYSKVKYVLASTLKKGNSLQDLSNALEENQ